MMRGCFCMSPSGTNVMGTVAAEGPPVCRCVSAADTSLSLSLSLFRLCGAEKRRLGAHSERLASSRHSRESGARRAPARGPRAACPQGPTRHSHTRACVDVWLVRPRLSQPGPAPLRTLPAEGSKSWGLDLLPADSALAGRPGRDLRVLRRSPICGSGWRGASRSRTQEAKCALHTSDRGRRDA